MVSLLPSVAIGGQDSVGDRLRVRIDTAVFLVELL